MSKVAPLEVEAELQAFAPVFGDLVLSLRLYHGQFNSLVLSSSCPNIRFLEIIGHVGLHGSSISSLVTHLPNLHYLRISNNGASSGFWVNFLTDIADCNIRELDISSNEISPQVASSVAGLLRKNQGISILNIANNPIEIQGFMEIVTAGANLQVLDVSDCAIATGPKSEEALHRTPILAHQLRVLKLNGNNFVKLPSSFWKYIFDGQRHLERLEMARVMWVQKDKDIRTLIRHIAQFPHIQHLDLSDNHVEELAMEAICFNLLLAPNAPLTKLILSGNTIKDTQAAGLARALRYNTCLQTLVLSNVSEYGLMELDSAISGNPKSAIQHIIVAMSSKSQVTLSHPHLFTLTTAHNPTYTYQMRWNPARH